MTGADEVGMSGSRSYPVRRGRAQDDPRWRGLVTEVEQVLTAHGYPGLSDDDWLALRDALLLFVYGDDNRGDRR